MRKRKHGMHKGLGDRISDRERELLGTAWDGCLNRCRRISLRRFTATRGIPHEIWRREYNRGASYKTIRNGNRWIHAEHDVANARVSIDEGKANMGARMKLWFPKGTNFNNFTRREIQLLEDTINSIHRKSLNGETANAYDSRLALAA